MGDHYCGPSLGQLLEALLNLFLGNGIESRSRLVQDEDLRVLQEDTGDGYSLFLTAGKFCPAFSHIGLELIRHVHDVIVYLSTFCGFHHFLIGGVRPSVADIFQDRIRKDKYVLLDYTHVLADGSLGHVSHVRTIDGYASAGNVVESGDQLAKRRFAAAGVADDGHVLAGFDIQIDASKHLPDTVI